MKMTSYCNDEIVCSLHTKSQFYVKALPPPDITMAVESNITTPQCISHQHNKFWSPSVISRTTF